MKDVFKIKIINIFLQIILLHYVCKPFEKYMLCSDSSHMERKEKMYVKKYVEKRKCQKENVQYYWLLSDQNVSWMLIYVNELHETGWRQNKTNRET